MTSLRRRLGRTVAALTTGTLLGALMLEGPTTAAATDTPSSSSSPVAAADFGRERDIKIYLDGEKLDSLRAEGRKREAAARAAGRTGPQPVRDALTRQAPQRSEPQQVKPSARTETAEEYFGAAESRARQMAAQQPENRGEQSVLALEPPPTIGDTPNQTTVNNCFADGAADNVFGHVYNRFNYCKRYRTDADYYEVRPNRPPEKVGTTSFTYEMFAVGDSQDRRIRLFARIQEDSVEYDWGWWDNIWLAPNIRLGMIGQCGESFEMCSGTLGPATLKLPLDRGHLETGT